MDKRNICVFDFETTGLEPGIHEICQIGALIIERQSLKILDKFQSLLKPTNWEVVSDEALKVNGLTREVLEEAPETEIVWNEFANWVGRFKLGGKDFFAPVPAGYNINGFDMLFVKEYCKKYGPYDKKWGQKLFAGAFRYDVFDLMNFFCESNSDLQNMKLTTVLKYMGLTDEDLKGAHDAMWDVEQTAQILIRLLKTSRYLGKYDSSLKRRRLEFANAFSNK